MILPERDEGPGGKAHSGAAALTLYIATWSSGRMPGYFETGLLQECAPMRNRGPMTAERLTLSPDCASGRLLQAGHQTEASLKLDPS